MPPDGAAIQPDCAQLHPGPGQPEGLTLPTASAWSWGGLLVVLTFTPTGVAEMGGKETSEMSPVTEHHRVPATQVLVPPRGWGFGGHPSPAAPWSRLDVVFITVRHGFAKTEG